MSEFQVILDVVSRGSSLALQLYENAGSSRYICQIAKSIENFCFAVKLLSGFIQDDNDVLDLISCEAENSVNDILRQCNVVLIEVKSINLAEDSSREPGQLVYLKAHLKSLQTTISVLHQTLFTAKQILRARVWPAISPQKTAATIDNEKTQLEISIIGQQISLLSASKLYETSYGLSRACCTPGDLYKYQENSLVSLRISEDEWISTVRNVSKSHLEGLLKRWTRIWQLSVEREQEAYAKRRGNLQPTVESGSDDEHGGLPKRKQALRSRIPNRDEEDETDLGIPWRLQLGDRYWEYIDEQVQKTNATQPPGAAYSNLQVTTTVPLSWVHPKAIHTSGFSYTRVDREKQVGREAVLEPCLLIKHHLSFKEIRNLVETTINIWNQSEERG